MTVDQLSNVLGMAFQDGFRDFLIGTIVAALPMLWVMTLALYLMRPYAIRTLRKLSLRFGADVFWLSYVLMRDGVLIATVVVSLVFFFPNVLHDSAIPVTAPLSGVIALWVLLLKMVRDPDENPADYRLTAGLLALGSALYLVPLVFGVEVDSQAPMAALTQAFSSSSNFSVAIGICYVSIALVAATGVYIFGYVMHGAAPSENTAPRPTAAARSADPSTAG